MSTIDELKVGGYQKFSTVDWPDHITATIFCQGCGWRCVYCHNKSLMAKSPSSEELIPWTSILALLEDRKHLLDGVVFSGGEPTLQKILFKSIIDVKTLGFKVGLHTAGMYPDRFKAVLPALDWVGFDIKAPFSKYKEITGVTNSSERVKESLNYLLEEGVDYQIRTTVYPTIIDDAAIEEIYHDLEPYGITDVVLQPYIDRRDSVSSLSLS